jgi:hypothetical protein
MSADREYVYTEVESKWATPTDRVECIRDMWGLPHDVPRWLRWRARFYAVRFALNPTARISWIIDNGGDDDA